MPFKATERQYESTIVIILYITTLITIKIRIV